MTLFRGLSAFPITPCDDAGRVLAGDLQGLVQRLVAGHVGSIGLLGSTGTYAYLSRAERARAVAAAAEVASPVPLIVGVGAIRTDDAVDLARDAAKAGAAGLLLAPVSYTPLTPDEVFTHYGTVAAATDLPLCIYNNPSTTRFNFDTALLARLAVLPTIKAVKMPLPAKGSISDDLAHLRAALPDDFVIGYSGDWGCGQALLAGADSWFSVAGGLWPDACAALTRAAMAGDGAKTADIDATFAPLWTLFQTYGSLRVVYAAATLMGLTTAHPPRPLLPLDAAITAEVAIAIADLPGGR